MDIIQIVPRLPPATDGVGDYAIRVANQLRVAHQIESHFIVGDPDWQPPANLEFDAAQLQARSSAKLMEALQQKAWITTVLLNYVGYGYAKRGCPSWLVTGLKRWLRKGQGMSLSTIFHELYAFGPPWTSSFWTSLGQRHLAKALALVSNELVTPMEQYAQILESFGATSEVLRMPVFSNVGELTAPTALQSRKSQIVIFGSALRRTEIYTNYRSQLLAACRALNLEAIVDVGVPLKTKPDLPLPFFEKGRQGAESISSLLANSRAGFLTYFDGYLAKSGVFAAYCAHGVLPIMPSRNASDLDGTRNGKQYLTADEIRTEDAEIIGQQIANSAHDWYQRHSIAQTASKLAQILTKSAK